MQNYFVYAIKSVKHKRTYIGMSCNPQKRLLEHNHGEVFSTKGFRPWILIFIEDTGNKRANARIREKYWKSGCGKEILKTL